MNDFYVYVLVCSDNSLYIGITKDVQNRLQQHNLGRGSKYVKTRTPASLLYHEGPYTRSQALKLEYQYKQLSRKEKLLKFVKDY